MATKRPPTPKRKGGNPPFVPTDEQRRMTLFLAAVGHTQATIATQLRISVDTLQRHLKDEFDEGRDFANSCVGEALLKEALKGDVKAAAEWFDRRGGPEWRKRTGVEMSGPGGKPIPVRDFSSLTNEELEAYEALTARLENLQPLALPAPEGVGHATANE